jgi:hypothetical protein
MSEYKASAPVVHKKTNPKTKIHQDEYAIVDTHRKVYSLELQGVVQFAATPSTPSMLNQISIIGARIF